MLNLGLIGNTEILEPHVKRIKKNPKVNIIGKASLGTNTRLNSFHFSIPEFNRVELVERADVILMDNTPNQPFTVISDIIRRSKHIFIAEYVNLSIEELLQLIKLANEGGTIIQLTNPFYYIPAVQWISSELENPVYLDITCFTPEFDDERKVLFPLLLMLHDITGLSPKKVAAVSFPQRDNSMSFNNVRLEYGDASVVNINYGRQESLDEFKIKTYSSGKFMAIDVLRSTLTANNQPVDLDKLPFPGEFDRFIDSVENMTKVAGNLEDFMIVQHAILKISKKLAQFSSL